MQPATFNQMTSQRIARRTDALTDFTDIRAAQLPVVGLKMLAHVADVRRDFAAQETLPTAPAR